MSVLAGMLFIVVIGVSGVVVVYFLLAILPSLDSPQRERQVEPEQPRREACADGMCLPSRANQITGMFYSEYRAEHAQEVQAQYERAASIRAEADGVDHGAEGSTMAESARELTAGEAAYWLGIGGRSAAAELPAGDDYVDGTWQEVGGGGMGRDEPCPYGAAR